LFPDSPHIETAAVNTGAGAVWTVHLYEFDFSDSVANNNIVSSPFNLTIGVWHNFIWTWQGRHHRIYVDGVRVADYVAQSHLGFVFIDSLPGQPWRQFQAGVSKNETISDYAMYNFSFTDQDAVNNYNATASGPLTPSGPYGIDATATWGFGERKVAVSIDAGNFYATRTDEFVVQVLVNDVVLDSGSLDDITSGYAFGLISFGTSLSELPAGDYSVQILAKQGNVVLGRFASPTIKLASPVPLWLGNQLGIKPAGYVQPPWTPITVRGTDLSVWGRTYSLDGGWGLPQQITSRGQNLLSAPVDIKFDVGSGPFSLTTQSLTINSAANDKVTWTGVATGNGVRATINGTLEYDGMMEIKLTLESIAAPVRVQSVQQFTCMPAARCRYWTKGGNIGQTLWHDPTIPSPNTTTIFPAISGFGHMYPSVCIADDDRALEWWCDSIEGWQLLRTSVDSPPPSPQRLLVDGSGNVTLRNDFITTPPTLVLGKPRTITFGYMAAPVKPLPSDWRTWACGTTGPYLTYTDKPFQLDWQWPGGWPRRETWGAFALLPGIFNGLTADTAKWISVLKSERIIGFPNLYTSPFTNYHVSVVDLENYAQQYVVIGESPGLAFQTRGLMDWWCWALNYDITNGVSQTYYIDEMYYGYEYAYNPLAGMGFVGPNGVSYNGWGGRAMRDFSKRLRQVQIDNGKRPCLWIDASCGYISPMCWSHIDVVSDGEGVKFPNFQVGTNTATAVGDNTLRFAFGFDSGVSGGMTSAWVGGQVYNVTHPASIPEGTTVQSITSTTITLSANVAAPGVSSGDTIAFHYPLDWIKAYWFGDNNAPPSETAWMRGLDRAEKYGWVSAHLDEIPGDWTLFCWQRMYRKSLAVRTIHDVSPEGNYAGPYIDAWLTPRVNFGMVTDTNVSFHPYWSQTEITAT
jgi:hypothetical protein